MGRALNSLSIGAAALVLAVFPAPPASAQSQGLVVRDGTLGDGPPEVGGGTDPLGQPATYLITPEMGEQRGSNLFHSFSSFGVATDETATFTGPDPIDGPQSVSNVISRVSGGEESRIDGTLRSTIPGADLFLINPSGVVFGEGATLDVPGSFHASTGNYLGFGAEGLERFYGDPSRQSVLSTAPPGAFGFLGDGPAAAISVEGARLVVPDGETLELVGGDVTLTAAELSAPAGAVSIRGGHIVVEEGSGVFAESTVDRAGGTISVAASESVLVDASLLSASTHSAGDAGAIRITSPEVTFQNGPGLSTADLPHTVSVGASAETTASGTGGRIEVEAESLRVADAVLSASTIGEDGVEASGDAGTIDIHAGSVRLERGVLDVESWGSTGDAGTIDVEADSLLVDGSGRDFPLERDQLRYAGLQARSSAPDSYLVDDSVRQALGDPGTITVTARSVVLKGRAGILTDCANCVSRADLGDRLGRVSIEAESIVVDGDTFPAYVGAHSFGDAGDAGTVEIIAGSLELLHGGQLRADASLGSGSGGSITVAADSVLIGGTARVGSSLFPAGIDVRSFNSTGDAGSIDITARTLAIEAGGVISANSFTGLGIAERGGNAGPILVTASESISVSNEGGEIFSLSRALFGGLGLEPLALTGVLAASVFGGEGGSVTLDAPDITISHGALVGSSTVGGLDGGTVLLRGDRIHILDGGNVNSVSLRLGAILGGAGGDVQLLASESIEVSGVDPQATENRSAVTSSSLGSGPAGTVTLRAPLIVVEDRGIVQTTAVQAPGRSDGNARGGDILLDAIGAEGQVIVRSGGLVDASSFVAEKAGDVLVTATESIVVTGEGSRIESRTGGAGPGGNVALSAPRIDINDRGVVSARSAPGYQGVGFAILARDRRVPPAPVIATGPAGAVTLTGVDELRLSGGTIATDAPNADGGSITIEARDLVHLDSGVITATVTGGTGGNVFIDPDVVILQNGSRIEARAGTGEGGHIRITTDNYFAFPGSVVSATAGNPELSGTVEVNAPDTDLAGALTALPASYLDAASLMRERCAARRSGERAGSFAVRGNGGIPAEPDGWLPAAVAFDATPVPLGMAEDVRTLAIATASTPSGASWPLARASCR